MQIKGSTNQRPYAADRKSLPDQRRVALRWSRRLRRAGMAKTMTNEMIRANNLVTISNPSGQASSAERRRSKRRLS